MKVWVTGTRGIPGVMGGVETHCEELMPRLAARGHEMTVVRRSAYVHDGLEAWKGVRLVDVASPKRKSFEAIVHTWRAVGAAARGGAEAVHIHAVGPALLVPYAKLRGLKVVFTHHGPDYERAKWGAAAKAMLRLGEWAGCRFADATIVISQGILSRVQGMCRGQLRLIPNGVEAARRAEDPAWFAELGIAAGRYVLAMSRFVPEKRLEDAVEAFARLKAEGRLPEGMKLVLAGDADFEDDYSRGLKERARAEGVVLPGFVKGARLDALRSGARMFVLPSSHEGLPIALLEAMSYGLPVAASDIGPNLEVALEGKAYYPCGDVAALADRMAEELGREGEWRREYDLARYDWERIADEVSAVYAGLGK